MTPATKKMLMIGGAAVAAYLIYAKVIKKPSAAATPAAAGAVVGGKHAFGFPTGTGMKRTETLADVEAELAGQNLGTLGRMR